MPLGTMICLLWAVIFAAAGGFGIWRADKLYAAAPETNFSEWESLIVNGFSAAVICWVISLVFLPFFSEIEAAVGAMLIICTMIGSTVWVQHRYHSERANSCC